MTERVQQAAKALAGAATAVVCGHVDPDGDALGSMLAITAALRAIGVDAQPAWGARDETAPPAPLDPALSFLPGADRVAVPETVTPNPDVLVCCDTAAPGRLGTLQPLLQRAGTVIVVDHHAVGQPFGDIRLIDEGASSTGVIALGLIDALGVALTPDIANALYLAILTDTGRFSFAATSAADHLAAARLHEAGADHVRVARAVYESASSGYLPLVARVTARARVDGGVLWSHTTQADLAETGAEPHETDGLIELLRRVEAHDVVLLLRQTTAGRWRCSMRSRGGTDVAAIAESFGGGGHRMAAGFTADGDPADVARAVAGRLAPVEVG